MAVRIFSGTDPNYEMVMEAKEPYSWSVGTYFVAKRKRDGKIVACNVIQLATAESIELVRREIEAERILDGCRGCRRKDDDIGFDPARLVVHLYSRGLPMDEGFTNLRTLMANPTEAKALTKANVFQIMASIVLALQDCHANGVVHGDIKPENIAVKFSDFKGVPFASAILAGFGIRTMATVTSPPGTKHNGSGVPGSPCYMAPECLDANNPSFSVKSDIFSLGCTLHELVCKTKAFYGTDRSFVPAMTAAGATFLGNSLAPMPGKMMQLHPDQRPSLDALEKWSRDYCLHRVVKKLGQAAWTSMALQLGAATSVHNPLVAQVMVTKSRQITAKAQTLDTASAQQAAVDAFFEVLTPPVDPAAVQPPPIQAGNGLTTPPQPPAAPGVQASTGQPPQAPRGLDGQDVTAPWAAVPPGVPTGNAPLAQPGFSIVTPSPPAVAPMVPAAVYPGAEGQTGNVYPVLTPNGFVYVAFPLEMLPQLLAPAAATSPPFQVTAGAWTPAQPAAPALLPAAVQPTSQIPTGYPPATAPLQQHIPASTTSPPFQLPAVTSLPPQEPEREVKGDEVTSISLAADGQPPNQSVTGYPPAIPPPADVIGPEAAREPAKDPSPIPAVPPGQTGIEPQDPALSWLATQPQFPGEPASTPAAIDTKLAAARDAVPIAQPPASMSDPATPRAPAGDDLQFKSPLGSSSTFALGMLKALNSPAGGAVLHGLAQHPHTPAAHGGHHAPAAHPHHPTTHHQHGVARHGSHHSLQRPLHPQSPPPPYVPRAPAAAAPAPSWPGGEPPPLPVSQIEHLFDTREAAERAAASPAYRTAWYRQQAQFATTQNILMGQFAAGNAALQAQSDSFQAWRHSANAQYASYQQAQQQRLDQHRINDANRHVDAQAFSLAIQGNTVVKVPFGGGDPGFARGNQVSADGGLYVVGDPNRIIQR